MANKKRYATGSRSPAVQKPDQEARWLGLLMALTLVPMVIGGLLILGWALDIYLWGDGSTQIYIGLLFILVSFAVSNGLQKKWYAAAGWTLLAISDLLLLIFINLPTQVIALSIGAAGLLLLGIEFYRRWRAQANAV